MRASLQFPPQEGVSAVGGQVPHTACISYRHCERSEAICYSPLACVPAAGGPAKALLICHAGLVSASQQITSVMFSLVMTIQIPRHCERSEAICYSPLACVPAAGGPAKAPSICHAVFYS